MPRRVIKGEPLTPKESALGVNQTGYERTYIGGARNYQSARFCDSVGFFELGDGLSQVFDHVQNGDHIKALRWKACGAQSALRSIQLQHFFDIRSRFAKGLDSYHIESVLMRLAEKRTPQTSDVEQFALASP